MPPDFYNFHVVPTGSSRPQSHPAELSAEIVKAIIGLRHKTGRGAGYIHYILSERQGLSVSLSSVKRTLKRNGLTKYSKWKKWHSYPPRPLPEKPGALIQVDTVHRIYGSGRLYVYALLDVYSRWAHALAVAKIGANPSAVFLSAGPLIKPALASKRFRAHDPEFSKWFIKKLETAGIAHRHSRVCTPNDNARLERFNRTIQEEYIARLPGSIAVWNKELPQYLHHYNFERPHMGIHWKTPMEMLEN